MTGGLAKWEEKSGPNNEVAGWQGSTKLGEHYLLGATISMMVNFATPQANMNLCL